ncbi:MAG: hypothetical protein JSS54_04800 [Proteobacteria bacterium]|nr:hypothetical protein [Pseudomonadota bacterium]
MFEELFHSILEQWSHVAETLFSGMGGPKILSFLIPIVPAAYGVFIKWRTSGYRMVDRLEEFIGAQEKRLDNTRGELAALVKFPDIHMTGESPAFPSRGLTKALRRMNWGYGVAATNDLAEAARVSADRARLSEALGKQHQKREALAHLLLGAKAASRMINDPEERSAARSLALEEFDKVLAIDPSDEDALEYSGIMLLELNEPTIAQQRFASLIECRKEGGGGANLARAYRLQAIAQARHVPPRNSKAYDALVSATTELPPGCTLDHAVTYEQLAIVAEKQNFTIKSDQYFQRAWSYYHALRSTTEGKKGWERVSAKLAAANTN